MNTGDMEKYCPKPHPVYFNAFSMWQQLSGSVQYLIKLNIFLTQHSGLSLSTKYSYNNPIITVRILFFYSVVCGY